MSLTDFNDLAVNFGLGEVTRQLRLVIDNPPKVANDETTDIKQTIAQQQMKDLQPLLNRYAKIMDIGRATNKVYDLQEKIEYTKTQFSDHIGNKALARLWFEANTKIITKDDVLKDRNELLAQNDTTGFFDRYILIYGTKEIWDTVEHERYPATAIELADKEGYDVWIKSKAKKMVKAKNIWFDPSRTRLPINPNDNFVNTYIGLPLKRRENADTKQMFEQAKPILELLKHLCEDNKELYIWVLRWLAIPLQNPGTKMDTALIFHGHIQGAGKSLFFDKIMSRIYGEYAVTLGQGQLESNYNDWVAGKLWTVFEEIFSGQDRYKHMGFVKQLVTGDQIYISKKFVSGWKEDNFTNTVFLSNDMMPLSLETNDRRHVVSYPKSKIPESLLRRVEVAVNNPSNNMIEAFYNYLLLIDVGEQNAHSHAIMTNSKKQLIILSQPSWETFYQNWVAGELDVPYCTCLSTDLFKYYMYWCRINNERATTATKFLSFIGKHEKKRLERYKTPHMVKVMQKMVICVNIPDNLTTSRQNYIGNEINQFHYAMPENQSPFSR